MTNLDLVLAMRTPGAVLRGTGKHLSVFLLQRPGWEDVKIQRNQINVVRDIVPMRHEVVNGILQWRMAC